MVVREILDLRAEDGSAASTGCIYGSEPGDWQRTFLDYIPPLLPQWPEVTVFVISSAADFRVPPPDLTSETYAQAVDEVMRLGALKSSERTLDQNESAVFWADGGGTATPPGYWNRIAADVIDQESLPLI